MNTSRYNFRLSPDLLAELESASNGAGVSASKFIRQAIRKHIKSFKTN